MIELQVKSYCNNCPEFDPICHKLFQGDGTIMSIVTCEHYDKCTQIFENAKRYLQKENENG